jgi:hypothetical protein
MPTISAETPREDYTIAGHIFSIPMPYVEGHVLTGGEASALNQTFAENARNNFASKVKEAVEAGTFDLQVFQGNLDDYLADYEFGVRRGGGGRSGDPVQAEAMAIAREKVRQAVRAKGHNLKDVPASQITELAKGLLANEKYADSIMSAARARVAAQQEVADIELGDLSGASEDEGEAPKGRKRAAAE